MSAISIPFAYDPSRFHPVIALPEGYRVYDFTRGPDPTSKPGEFGVGRYNEKREGMYTTPLFEGVRNIHMGVDISGPAGTPIHAFYDGEVFMHAYNSADGDYGYTLITRHMVEGIELFALHGHLMMRSIQGKEPGKKITKGEIIAWIGAPHENGGWSATHLHFQLSLERPLKCDMPGAVSAEQREEALRKFPDPRVVLGPLY